MDWPNYWKIFFEQCGLTYANNILIVTPQKGKVFIFAFNRTLINGAILMKFGREPTTDTIFIYLLSEFSPKIH